MKPFSIDKSSILLILILVIVAALAAGLFVSLRSDAADQALKGDRILNVLVILEVDRRPQSTELFMLYPATGKGALLDVPAETGLIIKSLNRVDRIDALYDTRRPHAYVDEIARLLAANVPYWIILDAQGLADAADLLDGLELFVPDAIADQGPPVVRLPSGALTLDGDKVLQYASWHNPDDGEADRAGRRQKVVQSFLKRIGQKSAWLGRSDTFSAFRRCLRTNLSDSALRRFIEDLGRIDADRLLMQRVTGIYRNVDDKQLLFPHYDGELVRDIVKQTLNALSNSVAGGAADKIYTIEVLNGTPSKGIAKKTAEIFQSFGYDVVSVGNADRDDYDRSIVLDRMSNPDALKNVASVIRCANVADQPAVNGQNTADFTVILGNDFNGRYCAQQP
jgi:anionic cell wall polymer biosynthesis LytR-Cps2A-Psr (LCP) family protein